MFWTKKVFSFQDSVAVNVRDIAAGQRWYTEKMLMHYSSTDVEQTDMVLGHSAEDAYLAVLKATGPDRAAGSGCLTHSAKLRRQSLFLFRDLKGNEFGSVPGIIVQFGSGGSERGE